MPIASQIQTNSSAVNATKHAEVTSPDIIVGKIIHFYSEEFSKDGNTKINWNQPNQFFLKSILGTEKNECTPLLKKWVSKCFLNGILRAENEDDLIKIIDGDNLAMNLGLANAIVLLGRSLQLLVELVGHGPDYKLQSHKKAASLVENSLVTLIKKYPKACSGLPLNEMYFNPRHVSPLFMRQLQHENDEAKYEKNRLITGVAVGALLLFAGALNFWFQQPTVVVPEKTELYPASVELGSYEGEMQIEGPSSSLRLIKGFIDDVKTQISGFEMPKINLNSFPQIIDESASIQETDEDQVDSEVNEISTPHLKKPVQFISIPVEEIDKSGTDEEPLSTRQPQTETLESSQVLDNTNTTLSNRVYAVFGAIALACFGLYKKCRRKSDPADREKANDGLMKGFETPKSQIQVFGSQGAANRFQPYNLQPQFDNMILSPQPTVEDQNGALIPVPDFSQIQTSKDDTPAAGAGSTAPTPQTPQRKREEKKVESHMSPNDDQEFDNFFKAYQKKLVCPVQGESEVIDWWASKRREFKDMLSRACPNLSTAISPGSPSKIQFRNYSNLELALLLDIGNFNDESICKWKENQLLKIPQDLNSISIPSIKDRNDSILAYFVEYHYRQRFKDYWIGYLRDKNNGRKLKVIIESKIRAFEKDRKKVREILSTETEAAAAGAGAGPGPDSSRQPGVPELGNRQELSRRPSIPISLGDAIKGRPSLKKSGGPYARQVEPPPQPGGSLALTLANALNNRRGRVVTDSPGWEDEDR